MQRSKSLLSNAGVFAAGAIFAAALVPACATDAYDETKYGGPTGLAGKPLPDPAFARGGAPAGDGGTTQTSTLCNGGPTVSDPKCAQKWSDIFTKYVKSTGTWKCADALCHLPGATGKAPFDPPISNDDAKKAWESLVAYDKLGAKRYINPCSKVPEDSAIKCNLVTPAACTPAMPETTFGNGAKAAAQPELDELNLWLACGAPNN